MPGNSEGFDLQLDEALSVVHASHLGVASRALCKPPGSDTGVAGETTAAAAHSNPGVHSCASSVSVHVTQEDTPDEVVREAKKVMRSIRRLVAAELGIKVSSAIWQGNSAPTTTTGPWQAER